MSKLQAAMTGQKEVTPYERFRFQVEKLRPEIAAMCGRENVDRFVRVSLNAVQANPKVLDADRKTLLLACLKAAQDGLLPDGREAVFNVYSTKVKIEGGGERWVPIVQYMPMSYGLIQLIYQAGATYVDGVPVYKEDEFDYQRGDDPKIIHRPYKGTDDPGEVVAAYVVVKLKSGEVKREVMFRRDIERVRLKSKQPEGLMWKEFYDQGAVKSVVHRICKQLPRAERLEHALAHDNEVAGLTDLPTDGAGSLDNLIEMRVERTIGTDPAGSKEPAAPKQGDPGTPEMKAQFLDKMAVAQDVDTLGIVMDDTRFFKWEKKDSEELEAKYNARKKALGGT